jgi:hypothetical protein
MQALKTLLSGDRAVRRGGAHKRRSPPIDSIFRRVLGLKSVPRRHRITSALFALASLTGTLGALSLPGYCISRNTESDLRFLEPRRAPTADEAQIVFPLEYALHSDEANDVVFLGDSTCRCGIDPASFERFSGLRAYNLGSQGKAGPVAFALTADVYLSKHPMPRIAVFCVSPLVCEMGGGDRREVQMQRRLFANYGPEVGGALPPYEGLLYFIKRGSLTALAAPSVWMSGPQQDVRELQLIGLKTYTYSSLQRRTREFRGYGNLPGLHYIYQPLLPLQGQPVTIRDDWDRGVRLLAETCSRRHVRLLFRFSPMPNECASMKDFSPVENWAKTFETTCPEMLVGRPTLLWYDWSLCWDAYHLNSQGVAKYTQALATEVGAVLARLGRDTPKDHAARQAHGSPRACLAPARVLTQTP